MLHTLADRSGPKLLALHELGGSHRDFNGLVDSWPGSVHALDLGGHGESKRLLGQAYSAETWAADADAALAHLGGAYVIGRGVGAVAALLLAGARPDQIPCAYLVPGRGLEACGEHPDETRVVADRAFFEECLEAACLPDQPAYDPLVIETEAHHRTRRYALGFAEGANAILLAEDGSARPAWWEAIRDCAAAAPVDERAGLAVLAAVPVSAAP